MNSTLCLKTNSYQPALKSVVLNLQISRLQKKTEKEKREPRGKEGREREGDR